MTSNKKASARRLLKMIDHIEAVMHCKDKPNFKNLQQVSQNIYGVSTFEMRHKDKIKVLFSESTKTVKVKGSLPMFMQGHNFTNTLELGRQAFENISEALSIDLTKAELINFEAGATFETEHKAKTVLNNHFNLPGSYKSEFKNGYLFSYPNFSQIKFYNAGSRIKQRQTTDQRQDIGFKNDCNYLRFEKVYLKHQQEFKKLLTVTELLSNSFSGQLQTNILQTYKNINRMKGLKVNKSACTGELFLSCFGEGSDKRVIEFIKGQDLDILTVIEKKYRIKAIRKLVTQINSAKVDRFNIEKNLKAELEKCRK